MEPTIRPMEVRDFAAVYELGLRSYEVTDKPYNYWSLREVADHLQSNPGLCFVADGDGRVVGFLLGDERFEILEDTAHLEWIAVDEEYRRRGIAQRLLERGGGSGRAARQGGRGRRHRVRQSVLARSRREARVRGGALCDVFHEAPTVGRAPVGN